MITRLCRMQQSQMVLSFVFDVRKAISLTFNIPKSHLAVAYHSIKSPEKPLCHRTTEANVWPLLLCGTVVIEKRPEYSLAGEPKGAKLVAILGG